MKNSVVFNEKDFLILSIESFDSEFDTNRYNNIESEKFYKNIYNKVLKYFSNDIEKYKTRKVSLEDFVEENINDSKLTARTAIGVGGAVTSKTIIDSMKKAAPSAVSKAASETVTTASAASAAAAAKSFDPLILVNSTKKVVGNTVIDSASDVGVANAAKAAVASGASSATPAVSSIVNSVSGFFATPVGTAVAVGAAALGVAATTAIILQRIKRDKRLAFNLKILKEVDDPDQLLKEVSKLKEALVKAAKSGDAKKVKDINYLISKFTKKIDKIIKKREKMDKKEKNNVDYSE